MMKKYKISEFNNYKVSFNCDAGSCEEYFYEETNGGDFVFKIFDKNMGLLKVGLLTLVLGSELFLRSKRSSRKVTYNFKNERLNIEVIEMGGSCMWRINHLLLVKVNGKKLAYVKWSNKFNGVGFIRSKLIKPVVEVACKERLQKDLDIRKVEVLLWGILKFWIWDRC
ncbi:hypothetical protein TDB9533_02869 [Thalassocella blandensis]|nr:hypothetical protein TDB9533_02869 [Thalassocella blandensis]